MIANVILLFKGKIFMPKKNLPSAAVRDLANSYLVQNEVKDFSIVSIEERLTVLQRTPKQFIKEKEITKGKIFKYIPHLYAKKALNFVFNFQVSTEVLKEDYNEYTEEYLDWYDKNCKVID